MLITHLNDDHKWKRERIADFVDSIERRTEREKRESVQSPRELLVVSLGENAFTVRDLEITPSRKEAPMGRR